MPDCKIFFTSGELLCSFSAKPGMKIGRSQNCDVCLKGLCDETVSREQLQIAKSGSDWIVKNIGNAHLYINGERVTEAILNEKTVARFSSYFLTVGKKSGPSPYDLTWDFDTENNMRRAVLWSGVNTIGASRDNDVVIRNNDVERLHAKIVVNDRGQIYIETVGMGRPISVNHVELISGTVEIKPGDEIMLGDGSYINLIEGIRTKNAISASQLTGSMTFEEYEEQQKMRKLARSPLGWIIAILIITLLGLLFFILFAESLYEMLFA